MAKNIIDIDLNQFGLPAVEGIRLIPLYAFNINQMSNSPEWMTCHFSQSCIVLKPSKYFTSSAESHSFISVSIDSNLKLKMSEIKIEYLVDNSNIATSIRA